MVVAGTVRYLPGHIGLDRAVGAAVVGDIDGPGTGPGRVAVAGFRRVPVLVLRARTGWRREGVVVLVGRDIGVGRRRRGIGSVAVVVSAVGRTAAVDTADAGTRSKGEWCRIPSRCRDMRQPTRRLCFPGRHRHGALRRHL